MTIKLILKNMLYKQVHAVHTRMYQIQNKTDDRYVRFTSTDKVYNNL